MFEVEPVGHFNLGHAQKPVKKNGRTDCMKYVPCFLQNFTL